MNLFTEPEDAVAQAIGVDPQVAIDKLFSLERASEIAAMLRGAGVKGVRQDAEHCPIAVWLSLFAPVEHGRWQVSTQAIRLIIGEETPDCDPLTRLEFESTVAVCHFVRYFDGVDEIGERCAWGFHDLAIGSNE